MGKSARDVQIQFSVMIAPRVNNIEMIGEKDKEIVYGAIQYDAKYIPVRAMDLDKSMEVFKAQIKAALEKHGFLR